jgi:tetratricopeptide (TPR) repeat protein
MDRESYDALVEKADGLPHGPTQIALLEEAVAIADNLRDEDLGAQARYQLTTAAQFGGRPDLSIVAFTWNLAYMDRHKDEVDESRILWQYKWVVNGAASFPDIPKPQIDSLFDDMVKRHKAFGSTLHAAHQIRRDMAINMHDPALAKQHDTIFRKLKRDDLSNCKACVPDANMDYLAYFGDDEAAIGEAKEIVRGRISCGEVPHRTYPKLMMCHLRLRQHDEAMRFFKLAYPMIRENPSFLEYHGACIAFMALTGNFNRTASMLSRHVPMALAHPDLIEQFRFWNYARLAVSLAIEAGKTLTWSIPAQITSSNDPMALSVWLDNEAATLAERFDRRNGNKGFEKAFEAIDDYRKLVKRIPYKAE